MNERRPHAILDLNSRLPKARKIEALIGHAAERRSLLEVGTGSGGIAHYFATKQDGRFEVHACDVIDNVICDKVFEFKIISDDDLPFNDRSMDVVVSNHVIEHVGREAEQLHHLREIRRVLKPGGILYLAVPNRWMLIEPHYKLAFLSWLPRGVRTKYLRFMGMGECYDCEPLEKQQIERYFEQAGFHFKNECVEALRLTFDIEYPRSALTRFVRIIPDFLLRPFLFLIPTLIYTAGVKVSRDG